MPPNVVFIMTDQQRPDTVGALGYPYMRTPHLDALVARGTALCNTYVQGATCTPSRASLVTGQYGHVHGAERNETWPVEGHPNWIELFHQGGYRTVNVGKMHTAPIFLSCGFDERFVVENKNYEQGKMGPPDDFDKLLAEHGLLRPAQRYMETVPDWFDRLGAMVWPYDEALFPDNVVGRRTVECLATHDFTQPL
jgi:arylsulfatase A-like enzyme